ncbi:MAG: cobalamin-binding protein [Trueperaceae bacterium]|nr:cobalamin-binding protein [Trueperaceae bacterium]
MRVVSLVPAATEIVGALGLTELLVAVSHDCDHPGAVADLPRITHCEIHGRDLPSVEIDRWVRETLAARGTLYTIDEPLLRRLAPDVILTQRLCDVCAPSYGSVAALAETLDHIPRLVNLEPTSLAEVLGDVRSVAEAIGAAERGTGLAAALEARIEAVRSRASDTPHRPTCAVIEWLDPLFGGGHWGPELVEIAGGADLIGRPHAPSARVTWEDLVAAEPEVLVIACCGNDVATTLRELPLLTGRNGWGDLPAVRAGRVHVADGSAYFSRPGPRIVDTLEILAGIMDPERFPEWAPSARPDAEVTTLLGPP